MFKSVLIAAFAGLAFAAAAEPVDEPLTIDGEKIDSVVKPQESLPFDMARSGWHYRTLETRALEADSFENPGMLFVERGEELWETVDGEAGKSCASCHDDASESMAGVGARYPVWDEQTQRPINLELRVNRCREAQMQAEPYKFDHADQKALVTFIKHQSLGMPLHVDISEGDMRKWWEMGEELYYKRTGQLNLSCATCHENYNGVYIRADHLSQGQINGFPTYRLKQSNMVSLHNRFRGCIRDTRAEYPAAFSDDLMALEVYVSWRGEGLAIETPAVRQ